MSKLKNYRPSAVIITVTNPSTNKRDVITPCKYSEIAYNMEATMNAKNNNLLKAKKENI